MDSPSSTSKKEVVNDVDDSSSHDQKQTRLKSQDGDDLIHSSGDKGTVEINSPVQRDVSPFYILEVPTNASCIANTFNAGLTLHVIAR